jgi:hypothetical protein
VVKDVGDASQTSSPSDPDTDSNSDQLSAIVAILLGAVFALVVASSVILGEISKAHISLAGKHILIGVYWCAVVLGVVIGLMVWNRKNPAVQKIYTVLLMIVAVGGAVILPVFYLDRVDRTLILKLGAIALLAMIPGLLYLQFIAVKGRTLRQEFILNLHRLQIDSYENLPTPPTDSMFFQGSNPTAPGENLYLQKFDALYGGPAEHLKSEDEKPPEKVGQTEGVADGASDSYTFAAANRLPVVLATLVLAIGWSVVLQPEPILARSLGNLGSVTLSGRPLLPIEPLRFAFAGSYFFILQMVIRRYFQDDLKPSAYVAALQRVIVVTLLITAVHQVWPWSASQENAFAFLAGVFPDSALKALMELLATPIRPFVQGLQKPFPLSDLDGMNMWYESRLVEEGIEDMQSLATANLVDVILRTRVPVNRLVDWIDQSILFLHVSGTAHHVQGQEQQSDRDILRQLGIRTATDLEDGLRPRGSITPGGPNDKTANATDAFVQKLASVLNTGPRSDWPSVTESIARAMHGEPNLYHVRQWKSYPDCIAATRLRQAVPAGAPSSAGNGHERDGSDTFTSPEAAGTGKREAKPLTPGKHQE